ncbi:MAG: APC family permease [Chloroflexota bacterium]
MTDRPGLERNAIGLTEVLFQSITHMAPAVAVALSIGAATTFAGGNTPLAVVFALIAALLTAFSIGELARHLPSAGGMYTYVGAGLGTFPGWLMAWAFLLAEPLVPPALFASFGLYGAIMLERVGITGDIAWIIGALICAGLVWLFTYRGISFSTRAGVLLGSIEIGIFLLIPALLVINAGSRNTLSVFVPGSEGVTPALAGMVFSLLAFVGFEASAPLGEEARDPKRTVRQAVLLSAVLVGAFYVFNYYAATVFFGPDRMASDFYTFNNGDPWGWMADQVLPGLGGFLVIVAILNSSLANANSGANASTRVMFSLGRSRLLPSWFGAVHGTHKTPTNAVNAQAIFGIVVALGLGLLFRDQALGGPLTVYVFIGYALGLLFAGMYILVNIAVIGFYLRGRRDEFNVVKHIVVPILGALAVVPAFIGVLGGTTIPFIGVEVPPLARPFDVVPAIVAIWMVIGLVAYLVIRARRPEAIATVGEAITEG